MWEQYYLDELQPLCDLLLAEAKQQGVEYWLSTRAADDKRETVRCAALIGLRLVSGRGWVVRETDRKLADIMTKFDVYKLPPFPRLFQDYIAQVDAEIDGHQWIDMFLASQNLGPIGGGFYLHPPTSAGWMRIERTPSSDLRGGLFIAHKIVPLPEPADSDNADAEPAEITLESAPTSPSTLVLAPPLTTASPKPKPKPTSAADAIFGKLVKESNGNFQMIETIIFNPVDQNSNSEKLVTKKLRPSKSADDMIWNLNLGSKTAVPFTVAFMQIRAHSGRVVPSKFTLDSAAFELEAGLKRLWYAMPVHHTSPRPLVEESDWLIELSDSIMDACRKRADFLRRPVGAGVQYTVERAKDLLLHMFGTPLPRPGSRATFALFAMDMALDDDGPPPQDLLTILADPRARTIFDNDPDNDNEMDVHAGIFVDDTVSPAPDHPIYFGNRRLAVACALVFSADLQKPNPQPNPVLEDAPAAPLLTEDEREWLVETAVEEVELGNGKNECGTLGSLVNRVLSSRANCVEFLRHAAAVTTSAGQDKSAYDMIDELRKMTATQLRALGLCRILYMHDGVFEKNGVELVIAPYELEAIRLFSDTHEQSALSLTQLGGWMRACLDGARLPSARARVEALGADLLWRCNEMAKRERGSSSTLSAADCQRPLPFGPAGRVQLVPRFCDTYPTTTGAPKPREFLQSAMTPLFMRRALENAEAEAGSARLRGSKWQDWKTQHPDYIGWWVKSDFESQENLWTILPGLPTFASLLRAAADIDLIEFPALDEADARRLATDDTLKMAADSLDATILPVRSKAWAQLLRYPTPLTLWALPEAETRELRSRLLADYATNLSNAAADPRTLLANLKIWAEQTRKQRDDGVAELVRRHTNDDRVDKLDALDVAIEGDRIRELRRLIDLAEQTLVHRADQRLQEWIAAQAALDPPVTRSIESLQAMRAELTGGSSA